MSHEFQSPDNKMARLYFFSCSDPAILTLQLPACFTRVLASSISPLASQSQDPVARSLLKHTLDQFFTLSHTQPLHYSHLNTRFLNAKLQANLARNKVNTQLNKFNLTEIKPTTLNFKSKLKYIQSHIQLGDIKVRFKIKFHSPLDRKVTWRLNQRSFIVFFHCKESYRGLYSYIYKSIQLIICYTIS